MHPHILLPLASRQVLQQEEARYNSADLNIAYKMSVDEYQRLCPFAEALEENWGKPPGAASVCRHGAGCQLCHSREALTGPSQRARCQPLSCRRSCLCLLQLGAVLHAGSHIESEMACHAFPCVPLCVWKGVIQSLDAVPWLPAAQLGTTSQLATCCLHAAGKLNSQGQNLLVYGKQFGNVFIGVQPTFGYEGDPMALLFSRSASPHHGFAAYYTYLEHIFQVGNCGR